MTPPPHVRAVCSFAIDRTGDPELEVATVAQALKDATERSLLPREKAPLLGWYYRVVLSAVLDISRGHASPRVRALAGDGMTTAMTDQAAYDAALAALQDTAATLDDPFPDVLAKLEFTRTTLSEAAVALQIAPRKLEVWHRRAREALMRAVGAQLPTP